MMYAAFASTSLRFIDDERSLPKILFEPLPDSYAQSAIRQDLSSAICTSIYYRSGCAHNDIGLVNCFVSNFDGNSSPVPCVLFPFGLNRFLVGHSRFFNRMTLLRHSFEKEIHFFAEYSLLQGKGNLAFSELRFAHGKILLLGDLAKNLTFSKEQDSGRTSK